MRQNHKFRILIGLSITFLANLTMAGPVGTAFTYQGQLKNAGSPVNGNTNMEFSLWDAASGGSQQGSTIVMNVSVSSGLFTSQLDFGVNPYTANVALWLEVKVNGTALTPRQPMTPTPFALNTRGLNVDASGRVGIGTAAPVTKLQVAGTAQVDMFQIGNGNSTSGNTQLVMGVSGDTNGVSAIQSIATSGAADGWGDLYINPFGANVIVGQSSAQSLIANGPVVTNTGFEFGSATGPNTGGSGMNAPVNDSLGFYTAGTERIRIDGTGNVGIGMASPVMSLDISPNSTIGNSTLIGDADDPANQGLKVSYGFQLATPDLFAGMRTLVGPGTNGCGNTGDIRFDTWECDTSYSREVMRITGRGNVGIGTTAPVNNLQVAGTVSDHMFQIGNGDSSSGNTQLVMGVTDDTGGASDIQSVATSGATVGDLLLNRFGGNVGIGTTSPASRLDVRGGSVLTDYGFGFSSITQGPVGAGTYISAPAGDTLAITTAGTERMRVTNAGNVGIGSTSPGVPLEVRGNSNAIRFGDSAGVGNLIAVSSYVGIATGDNVTRMVVQQSNGNVGIGTTAPSQKLAVSGNICATGTIGACSDARFKEHIAPVADALDMVEQLHGVTFDWKREEFCDHQFADGRQLGFIAQEVRKVLPQVVSEGSDGYLSVDYGRLTPVIVEAIKQIKSEKDEQIASLQNENAALKARLDRIESLISKGSD